MHNDKLCNVRLCSLARFTDILLHQCRLLFPWLVVAFPFLVFFSLTLHYIHCTLQDGREEVAVISKWVWKTWCCSRLSPRTQRICPRLAAAAASSSSSVDFSICSTSCLDAAPSVMARGIVRVGIHVTSWQAHTHTHAHRHTDKETPHHVTDILTANAALNYTLRGQKTKSSFCTDADITDVTKVVFQVLNLPDVTVQWRH